MAAESSENPSDMMIINSTFQFQINYLISMDLPVGKGICSPVFTAGGCDWSLEFYPQGIEPEWGGAHASISLVLVSEVKDVSVECIYQVLDNNGQFVTVSGPEVITYANNEFGSANEDFLDRYAMEQLSCVNGVLVISCSIRVLTEPKVVQAYTGSLREHIEKFWEKKERFDVTFEVEGEKISAHRFMLAARSPVFEAQLFGPMAESKKKHIKIDEMKAEVFKALLHFVYTDELVQDESSDQETPSVELFQDLIVAADRYAIDRLVLLCEEQLEKNLSVDTVVTTLLLADRHSRARLKQKCLEFASSPENFAQVALTERNMTIMLGSPSLLAELRQQVSCLSHSAKEGRIG